MGTPINLEIVAIQCLASAFQAALPVYDFWFLEHGDPIFDVCLIWWDFWNLSPNLQANTAKRESFLREFLWRRMILVPPWLPSDDVWSTTENGWVNASLSLSICFTRMWVANFTEQPIFPDKFSQLVPFPLVLCSYRQALSFVAAMLCRRTSINIIHQKLHRHRPQIEKVGTDGSQRGNQRLPWQGTAGSQTLKLTVPNLGTRGYHCKELPVPRS